MNPRWSRMTLMFVAAASIFSFCASRSTACDVPVFRYVLEYFESDPHEFVIFHRGPLSAEVKAAVDATEKLADDQRSPVHIRVRLVDLAAATAEKKPGEQPASIPQWTPPVDATLPWLAVVPIGRDGAPPVWSGPLRSEDLRPLVDSPVRRELVRRLCTGDSAVFLLLSSGNREADDAAGELLQTTLAEQAKTLQLPPQDETSPLHSKLPLKIAFSVLRVARNDPAERCLVEMLDTVQMLENVQALINRSEAAGQRTDPIVFPVFGRGRILGALWGDSLRAETVQKMCEFICGSCACPIVDQMPGVDLLLAADWDSLLAGRLVRDDSPVLRGLGPLAVAASGERKQPLEPSSAPMSEVHSRPLSWTLLATLACVAAVVLIGTVLLKAMRPEGRP